MSITETDAEVRIRIDARWDPDGDIKKCFGGGQVPLQSPIGTRRLVDARSKDKIPLTFLAATAPPPPSPVAGSVGDVIGQEAPATVTAWFVQHRTYAKLCDELTADGDRCLSRSISVDFVHAPYQRPVDLVVHEFVQVSRVPVTLVGALRVNVLEVGAAF